MNVIRVLKKRDSGTDNVMMEAEAGVMGRSQGMKASEAGKDERDSPRYSRKNHPAEPILERLASKTTTVA